jgi:hypothetical protein
MNSIKKAMNNKEQFKTLLVSALTEASVLEVMGDTTLLGYR